MTIPDEPLQQKMHNLLEFERVTVVGEANKYALKTLLIELHVGKFHNSLMEFSLPIRQKYMTRSSFIFSPTLLSNISILNAYKVTTS
jgi:hypothetical protein